MAGVYIYNSLISAQHIRIITLAPSEDDGADLQCSLGEEHIDDPVKEYEAISYTWGGQERTERLQCDGSMIYITPNLASALLCLRYRTRPRRLWADAVCINQADLDEKGQQIPLMARIFQAATQVRVWLGDGADGESLALAGLASLDQIGGPTRSSIKHPLLARKHHDPELYQALADIGRSAKKVLRMPWFGRRWIVQELVLNGNVIFHCGKSQISWQGLHIAFHALPESVWDEKLDAPVRRKLSQLRELWRTWCYANVSAMDCGIYSLLHSFHDLECQEPKDKLYAIASLADDIELKQQPSPILARVPSIIPDYETSDEQLFEALALKLIRSGKVFDTLAHAGASSGMESERPLPSWALDFRKTGLWPLIARENKQDFHPVEVCEHSNGTLILRISVYDWLNVPRWLQEPQNLLMESTLPPELMSAVSFVFDYRSLSVMEVFKAPENWIDQDAVNLLRDIEKWINSGDRLTTHQPLSVADIDRVLWSVIQSQMLAEYGPESLDSQISFELYPQGHFGTASLYALIVKTPNTQQAISWASARGA